MMNDDKTDPVWKALSDPTRRRILDLLRKAPLATTAIVEAFPELSRFGVMKHLEVLRRAGLVLTREEGRRRINRLNATPIRMIYERWVRGYQDFWAGQLADLKIIAEKSEAASGAADREESEPGEEKKKKSR